METTLRLILLLLGIVIVAGIVWDARRSRFKKKKAEALAAEVAGKECFPSCFDDVRVIVKPEKQEPILQDTEIREEIMTLNIMARTPNIFTGKKLKSAFADTHLYYGELQIFHRFDNIDGTGGAIV